MLAVRKPGPRRIVTLLIAVALLLPMRGGVALGTSYPFGQPTTGTVISDFGDCRDGCSRLHEGYDIDGALGDPIFAAYSGTVSVRGNIGNYGLVIYVDHASGYQTRYAHLQSFAQNITVGDKVYRGQLIGYKNNTGNAAGTPTHLHYEIRRHGGPLNLNDVLGTGTGVVARSDLQKYLSGLSIQNLRWFQRNANSGGPASASFLYGLAGDIAVSGDWNGDGVETVGVFRAGKFFLRNSNTQGGGDVSFWFGAASDLPVAGDWNGDGIDTVGVFRPLTGQWFLRDANSGGPNHYQFYFGAGTDLPVVGDWDGDGRDTIGVYRSGRWFLRNSNSGGPVNYDFWFGAGGDDPITGDWNGDGVHTIGVFRQGHLFLRNSNSGGPVNYDFWFGANGDRPVPGDWDGNGTHTPGVARNE